MRPRLPRLAALAAAAVALVATACQPEPIPGTVDLTGDSITLQAMLAGSGMDSEPADLRTYAGLGWQVHDAYDAQSPQDWVHDEVYESERPEVLVEAFGVNDASPSNGGWQLDDVGRFIDLLRTPHPDTCIVVVLPGYGDGISSAHAAEIRHARADLRDAQQWRDGPVVTVSWQKVIEADPSVMDGDGIHLAGDPDGPYGISVHAAEARMGLYWQGVEQCQAAL